MARLPLIASVLAMLAACVALYFLLSAGEPPAEPAHDPVPEDVRQPRADNPLDKRPARGGVYAGVVVDADDRPIHGARVLLVAYGAGEQAKAAVKEQEVPVVGGYRVGGEAITDEDGRFRIAADSQSYITRVLAYHSGYFVDVAEVSRPRDDLRLTLTLLLWFLYAAYLILRQYTEGERRATLSAVLALMGVPAMVLNHFAVTLFPAFHPQPVAARPDGPALAGPFVVALVLSVVAYTLVYAWLLVVRVRLERLRDRVAATTLSG